MSSETEWYTAHMKKEDIYSIAFTFVLGLAVGIYVYISGFAGFWSNITVSEQSTEEGFVLVADVYGVCRSDCPSFRVDDTGSYRYIYPVTGGDSVTRDGRLPYGIRQELRTAMESSELVRQSQETTPAMCDSYVDGIDVRYTINYEGAEYVLDTCGSAVDTDSTLWASISGVWDFLEMN